MVSATELRAAADENAAQRLVNCMGSAPHSRG